MWSRSTILKSIIIKSQLLKLNCCHLWRLSKQCDILFYEEFREVEFSQINEVYSLSPIAFAKDGSGGEYVIHWGWEYRLYREWRPSWEGGQKALGTCLPSYFMLNLSQIFPVVCSIITSICCHNSVKDISTKYEKTISQKVKIEIKWELDLHKSWDLNLIQKNCKS